MEEVSGIKIALPGSIVQPDEPPMKLVQPPQWTPPVGDGGKSKRTIGSLSVRSMLEAKGSSDATDYD